MKHLLWIAIILFSTTAWSSDFVTKGDITKSKIKAFKPFFTKDVCDQVLIDTFSICYDHERKSPTAVYVLSLIHI